MRCFALPQSSPPVDMSVSVRLSTRQTNRRDSFIGGQRASRDEVCKASTNVTDQIGAIESLAEEEIVRMFDARSDALLGMSGMKFLRIWRAGPRGLKEAADSVDGQMTLILFAGSELNHDVGQQLQSWIPGTLD